MKISDIVKVNIDSDLTYSANSSEMNSTAAVLYISNETGTNDLNWLSYEVLEGLSYSGNTVIDTVVDTYISNGGISLLVKRLYFDADADPLVVDTLDALKTAIYGGVGIGGLPVNVKNIQLAFSEDYTLTTSLRDLAQGLVNETNSDETKLLFVTSNTSPVALITEVENVFYHYYIGDENYYESAAAMAYLSKINYSGDIIRDYEYTVWAGNPSEVNIVSELPASVEDSGRVNYFTTLANRRILINGVMTNGVRLTTYYFQQILTERITNLLGLLTIQKLNFDQSTFSFISNLLSIELDKFSDNNLLNNELVVPEQKFIFRDGIKYVLAEKGEKMEFGYILQTLPPTANDINTRNYSGVYILLAFANQIRTIDITGIVIGGIQ